MEVGHWYYTVFLMNIFRRFSSILNFYSYLYFNLLTYRCNRLRCPLARFFWIQCFNMGHNGYGINLYGVIMILMKLTCRTYEPSTPVHIIETCINLNYIPEKRKFSGILCFRQQRSRRRRRRTAAAAVRRIISLLAR